MPRKYPFSFSLFTAGCKKKTGTIKASTMRMAKKVLKVKFPRCTKIDIKSMSSADDIARSFNIRVQ